MVRTTQSQKSYFRACSSKQMLVRERRQSWAIYNIIKSLTVLHDTKLKEANEEEDLDKTSLGDGVGAEDGGKTVGEGIEGVFGLVDAARKVDAVAGDDLAEEGKLTDTAVLDLNVTEAVEALLVGILKKAEGIEEAKGGLGAELGLEGLEGGGGGTLLGGGEGGGAGNDRGNDGRLEHGFVYCNCIGEREAERYVYRKAERTRGHARADARRRSLSCRSLQVDSDLFD